jgi:hypothetical protein
MKEESETTCGREHELVTFLYGELPEDDAHAFTRHLRACVSCSAELQSFGLVHESVKAWRDECVGRLVSVPDAQRRGVDFERPSAVAALREFFIVSPLWLKGAVAFGSVLFCLLALLAVARLRESQPVPAVAEAGPGYSQQQIDSLVERRVQEELDRQRNQAIVHAPPQVIAGHSQAQQRNRYDAAADVARQKAKRPLSRTEREQLAADLRLTSAWNESDFDLLDDRINQ